MNSLLKKHLFILLIPVLLTINSCTHCTRVAAPYIISQVIVLGHAVKDSLIVEYISKQIDRGIRAILAIIADRSTQDLVSDNDIVPIDDSGQLGRKTNDPKFKIKGEYSDGQVINHTIIVPKEKVLFQRTNRLSQWKLTPDSRDEIAKRLLTASVQVALKKYGYSPKGVDGVSGKNTAAAVKAFQGDTGLPVTGEIDDATSNRLLKR